MKNLYNDFILKNMLVVNKSQKHWIVGRVKKVNKRVVKNVMMNLRFRK